MTVSANESRRVFLMGAGGHASVLLDLLLLLGIVPAGVTDKAQPSGGTWQGIPVIGDDDFFFNTISPSDALLANGLGANPDCGARNRLYSTFKERGYDFPVLRHPSATISERCVLREGAVVMAGAVVQSGTSIGENVVVNTSASIDHDCLVEDGAFISPGAVLCGSVSVRKGAFIGAGAVLLPGVEIGAGATVGAGAVVTGNVFQRRTVVGVPARELS